MPLRSTSWRWTLLAAIVLATAIAGPAQAKKSQNDDDSERGGVFHPPAAIAIPTLILDSAPPKPVLAAASAVAAAPAPHAKVEAKPAVEELAPRRIGTIADFRLHTLFE